MQRHLFFSREKCEEIPENYCNILLDVLKSNKKDL